MLYDHFLSAKSPEMNKGTQRYKDISWLTTPPTHAVVWALRPPTYTSRCAGTRLHGASVDLPRQCSDGIIGELMSGDCKMFVGSGGSCAPPYAQQTAWKTLYSSLLTSPLAGGVKTLPPDLSIPLDKRSDDN